MPESLIHLLLRRPDLCLPQERSVVTDLRQSPQADQSRLSSEPLSVISRWQGPRPLQFLYRELLALESCPAHGASHVPPSLKQIQEASLAGLLSAQRSNRSADGAHYLNILRGESTAPRPLWVLQHDHSLRVKTLRLLHLQLPPEFPSDGAPGLPVPPEVVTSQSTILPVQPDPDQPSQDLPTSDALSPR